MIGYGIAHRYQCTTLSAQMAGMGFFLYVHSIPLFN